MPHGPSDLRPPGPLRSRRTEEASRKGRGRRGGGAPRGPPPPPSRWAYAAADPPEAGRVHRRADSARPRLAELEAGQAPYAPPPVSPCAPRGLRAPSTASSPQRGGAVATACSGQRRSPAPASCNALRPLRPPLPPLPPSPRSPATAPGSRSTEMVGFGGPGSPATVPSYRSTEMAGFGVPGSPLPLPPPSSSLSVHGKSSS